MPRVFSGFSDTPDVNIISIGVINNASYFEVTKAQGMCRDSLSQVYYSVYFPYLPDVAESPATDRQTASFDSLCFIITDAMVTLNNT